MPEETATTDLFEMIEELATLRSAAALLLERIEIVHGRLIRKVSPATSPESNALREAILTMGQPDDDDASSS